MDRAARKMPRGFAKAVLVLLPILFVLNIPVVLTADTRGERLTAWTGVALPIVLVAVYVPIWLRQRSLDSSG